MTKSSQDRSVETDCVLSEQTQTVSTLSGISACEAREVEKSETPLGHELVNQYKVTRHDDPMDLVELARAVQHGSESVKYNACNQLRRIADQIRILQEQAAKVLIEAKRDTDLHQAACNLVKKPGTVYHLYRRDSGETCLSILSPQEWGPRYPHEHLGAYRLNYDNSWTHIEDLERREEEDRLVGKILDSQLALPSTVEIQEKHG